MNISWGECALVRIVCSFGYKMSLAPDAKTIFRCATLPRDKKRILAQTLAAKISEFECDLAVHKEYFGYKFRLVSLQCSIARKELQIKVIKLSEKAAELRKDLEAKRRRDLRKTRRFLRRSF